MLRRQFLTLPPALALGGLGLTLVPRPATAQAAADVPTLFTAVVRRSVGEMTVTALGDGFLPLDAALLQGISPEETASMVTAAHLDPSSLRSAVNTYLVETGDRKILIDAGTGNLFGPTLGHVTENLAAAGVAADEIDTLLVTHLHPDHVGGAATEAGAVFPNAAFLVSAVDHAFFTDRAAQAAAPEFMHPFWDIAAMALSGYGDRVQTFEGEAAVAPGITAMPLPGHTPGHCGFVLESGGESLLVWADLVHVPPVQFARPAVTLAFDIDPEAAAATRARVYDMAATDGQMVCGAHLFFPGFGHVERRGEAYAFAPAPWEYF